MVRGLRNKKGVEINAHCWPWRNHLMVKLPIIVVTRSPPWHRRTMPPSTKKNVIIINWDWFEVQGREIVWVSRFDFASHSAVYEKSSNRRKNLWSRTSPALDVRHKKKRFHSKRRPVIRIFDTIFFSIFRHHSAVSEAKPLEVVSSRCLKKSSL